MKPSPQTSPSWGEKVTADTLLLPRIQGHRYEAQQHFLFVMLLYLQRGTMADFQMEQTSDGRC